MCGVLTTVNGDQKACVYLLAPSPRLEEALRAAHRYVEIVP